MWGHARPLITPSRRGWWVTARPTVSDHTPMTRIRSGGAGDTVHWRVINASADAHPMHLHGARVQVINREPLVIDPLTGVPVIPAVTTGAVQAPRLTETGYKDIVLVNPGMVTRIKATFEIPGLYVWHCHIVEHEDNEMMRPYRIGPVQAGQPA